MKKIKSLFKRDYETTRQVYDKVVPGSEWVINGEGIATEKFDGTSVLFRDGKLYKRYDRKPNKAARKQHIDGTPWNAADFKVAPPEWESCEDAPNVHTGHWPGWMPVGDGPEDKWFRFALQEDGIKPDGTYELVGPKFGANPHSLDRHYFWKHGSVVIEDAPRTFDRLSKWLSENCVEGIVWHHPDGRMVKLKRRDFGYNWPCENAAQNHAQSNLLQRGEDTPAAQTGSPSLNPSNSAKQEG